jgi:sodium-dependent dicarboxylate transporter 2/3/5
MDPSVLFIFASIVIGMVFTKTGLTRRLAYKMLAIVGERTSMIYLGCFLVTAGLTHIMAHTAVAATIYPLLLSIYGLYGEGNKPTRFGKGLLMGMAYVAGAGSIVTLLGAARGPVAKLFLACDKEPSGSIMNLALSAEKRSWPPVSFYAVSWLCLCVLSSLL